MYMNSIENLNAPSRKSGVMHQLACWFRNQAHIRKEKAKLARSAAIIEEMDARMRYDIGASDIRNDAALPGLISSHPAVITANMLSTAWC